MKKYKEGGREVKDREESSDEMSYTVNATKARLFGFAPKYVWDEFVVEHAAVALRIKKETFGNFLDMEYKELEIVKTCQNILRENQIDTLKYGAEVKRRRERAKNEAMMIGLGEGEGQIRGGRGNRVENEEYEGDYVKGKWDEEDERERRLKESESKVIDEGMEWEDFVKELREVYKEVKSENDALKEELRRCQQERDSWRKKYYILMRNREDSSGSEEELENKKSRSE